MQNLSMFISIFKITILDKMSPICYLFSNMTFSLIKLNLSMEPSTIYVFVTMKPHNAWVSLDKDIWTKTHIRQSAVDHMTTMMSNSAKSCSKNWFIIQSHLLSTCFLCLHTTSAKLITHKFLITPSVNYILVLWG